MKRDTLAQTCQLKIKNIQNDLESFQFEIGNLDHREEAKYKVKYNAL